MIFVTIGNHDQEFSRLIKKLDSIASKIKEEIIIQKGHTKYISKNCQSFAWDSSLAKYMKGARLIITHAGIGTTLEILKIHKKPMIVVPRQYQFNEHVNNHQVEFAKVLEKKHGVKVIYNINDLTPEMLKKYNKKIILNDEGLKRIQSFLKYLINEISESNNK